MRTRVGERARHPRLDRARLVVAAGASAVIILVASGCAPRSGNTEISVRAAPADPVTLTLSSPTAPPGSVLGIDGTCGSGAAGGHADIDLLPEGPDTVGALVLPIDETGQFHGGFVISPRETAGAKFFALECFAPGARAAGGGKTGIPLTVTGPPSRTAFITVTPSTALPGTTVSVHGSDCSLDGASLATARVKVNLGTDTASAVLNLTAPIDTTGSWSTTFTVPSGVGAAQALITAVCERADVRAGLFVNESFFTTDPPAPPPPILPPPTTTTSPPVTPLTIPRTT